MTFTSENREHAEEIIAKYPQEGSAILPLAHLAQDQDGYLSDEMMQEIAQLVGATPAEVAGTCSFYTMFKREPVGKILVSVCTNATCLVLGGPELLGELRDRYAQDNEVTVEEVECLAACDGAPCLQVNYEFHENMTAQTTADVIEEYKSGMRKLRTISGTAT